MENTKDVVQGSSPVEAKVEGVINTTDTAIETGSTNVVTRSPGANTPPENLYAALQEERRKRKEAEDKLNSYSILPAESEVYSDEGKQLNAQITGLKQQVQILAEEKEMERLRMQNPILVDKSDEFKTFKENYPAYKTEDVVKLFLVENGMSNEPRKGLERRTVGAKVPTSGGYTSEELSNLRKNDFRKYTDLITSGKVNFSELK